jgi:acetyltransferase
MGAMADFSQKRQIQASRSDANTRPVEKCALQLPAGAATLGEHESKSLLAKYGLPSVNGLLLNAEAIEALATSPLKFPLAIKIESPDIPHKTEAGAVKLGVNTLGDLKAAARTVLENALRYRPDARINGLLLQEMTTGIETIVGVVNDVHFGPTVMFGLGGIMTELLHDVTYRFAPFDAATAVDMIKETKAHAMLGGFRGKPAADVDALAEYLSHISWLAADHADRIAEIDVNPLFVCEIGAGVRAADALIVLR